MKMTIFLLIGAAMLGTMFAALRATRDEPKPNRRKHSLGRWLKFHRQIF